MFWHTNEVCLRVKEAKEQYVIATVSKRNGDDWLFTTVYASPNEQTQDELFEELGVFALQNHKPWLLAGDFNETRSLLERKNCSDSLQRCCTNFDNWKNNNALFDLGFVGLEFTWCQGKNLDT